ncbi:hypothetical protein [Lachnospira sp.]|jgi:hypothetical protein|uniref:hypothetical protein n=1 Tax=Lachnospira sp. TaxID=2049031 RepID=UPI00257CBF0C|nr:hypothetical protein [Lachnospira sp.]
MADRLLIEIPEGYSGIDIEKSDFDKGIIVFKKKQEIPWEDSDPDVKGFYIDDDNRIIHQKSSIRWIKRNRNIFATEEQARSAQAMAELSQIIANDERFGGPITGVEWSYAHCTKYIITRIDSTVGYQRYTNNCYFFLAFHTEEQARLFLEENEDLIKQYYMID